MPIPRVTTLGDSIEEAMRKPPDGWLEWLREFDLWDEGMSEKAAFTRYWKFHKVEFQAIPRERWHIYFKRLVALEDLFVVGDAIGEVPGQEFTFEVFDKTPIRQKPRPYPPHQREWVKKYCEK